MREKNIIDEVSSENMSYSDDSLYNITSFGTDLSYREIVSMYKEGDLEKPELQRKYVWTKKEASKFIDSILLGLPVPSIFLAKTKDDKRLIVDGYQRIMTVYDYMEGIFSGDKKVFKLSNTEDINSAWRGKAFNELTDIQKRRIRTSPIHAIVFEQKSPSNDTGMYQIFERINTGGRTLKPQEIRNCVYHGDFNRLLFELNKDETWRTVLDSKDEDSRMADVELILRFFAFSDIISRNEINQNQIILSKFLNEYMGDNSTLSKSQYIVKKNLFQDTIESLHKSIGANVFRNLKYKNNEIHWAKKVNPVIFDAICSATVYVNRISDKEYSTTLDKYIELLKDSDFRESISKRTTNIENIKTRISKATDILYGVTVVYE
ncbi:DUF262 domain-containing protein [Gemella sanguinis]|uniref:DUF262 domain-containing protein n=1 Tax=Gemella sanguinis TaxID=84135 RepID=UPI00352DB801